MSSFYATPATKRSKQTERVGTSRNMAQESMSFHGACSRAVRLKFRPCANGKSLAKFHNDFGDGMLDTEYYWRFRWFCSTLSNLTMRHNFGHCAPSSIATRHAMASARRRPEGQERTWKDRRTDMLWLLCGHVPRFPECSSGIRCRSSKLSPPPWGKSRCLGSILEGNAEVF